MNMEWLKTTTEFDPAHPLYQAYVHKSVMEELKRIIDDSEITKEDDALWPPPDRVGRQVCDPMYR